MAPIASKAEFGGDFDIAPKRQAVGLRIYIQEASEFEPVPSSRKLTGWLRRALVDEAQGELSIRIVGEHEGAALNERYRGRSGPTNVLSFAGTELPDRDASRTRLLGDLVICAPVIEREAREQGKALDAHWAHIALHGTLHLLGYDHETDEEAKRMERREVELLAVLGFDNPYDDQR